MRLERTNSREKSGRQPRRDAHHIPPSMAGLFAGLITNDEKSRTSYLVHLIMQHGTRYVPPAVIQLPTVEDSKVTPAHRHGTIPTRMMKW
jgi:hypothetical protein